MKIVILDGYNKNPGDLSWEPLNQLGTVTLYDHTSPDQALDRMGDAEIVLTNKVKITGEMMEACPKLQYIGITATGYDVVDLAAAKQRGIVVTNVPVYGTQSVAQHTIALLLELSNQVGRHNASVQQGDWCRSKDFCYWVSPITELAGKTMAIVGYGKIGRATGQIAQALGMRVLAVDNWQDPDQTEATYVTWEEALAQADVLSFHCGLTAQNRGMVCSESIEKMKDGVWILNTARGGLIVEQDLRQALETGKVGAAALDVVSAEPMKGDNPLLGAPNCILTPHIGGCSRQARERLLAVAMENVAAFLKGNPIHVIEG